MTKPSIPKGTRDFLPDQALKRAYIFEKLKSVFEKYGYGPIETPAMEKLETLTGKYGEEGDRLIYKILNSGDFMGKYRDGDTDPLSLSSGKLATTIAEKALRYDLTVPFARFVVQHRNDLTFPFKRYQIQPVWRADRPQKGRYREFFQCDVDVVGTKSLLNEVELVQIANEGFSILGLPDVEIRLNNRKVLAGLAEVLGESEKLIDLTVALDKLDKIGVESVKKELKERGISDTAIEKLGPIMSMSGNNEDMMSGLRDVIGHSEIGAEGISELETVLEQVGALGINNLKIDVTLARGLNYYTGAIFEVGHPEFPSSICGGGRYDDLTGIFGMSDLSGVGISFGADRIYDLMVDKNLFPDSLASGTDLLFVNFGPTEAAYCMQLATKVRGAGFNAEVFPDPAKMKKQMAYADAKKIRFVALIGTNEMEAKSIRLKHMETGEQTDTDFENLLKLLG